MAVRRLSEDAFPAGASPLAGGPATALDLGQLHLPFPPLRLNAPAAVVTSESNAQALAMLRDWRAWPNGALLLCGPKASGKSAMAREWADRTGAALLSADRFDDGVYGALSGHVAALVEDADRRRDDVALFHIMNAVRQAGGALLLTARALPTQWGVKLPDLRTRLTALAAVELGDPDDALLKALIAKGLRARQVRPADDVLDYALTQIDRSFDAVQRFVEALDYAAMQRGQTIRKELVTKVAEGLRA
ncbi:MAG: hypothetical protein AAF527_01830 [Pseudomonadota bacterium]